MSTEGASAPASGAVRMPREWAGALARLAAGLTTVPSTALALETVAANCPLPGRVGWALLLTDDSGTHLFCSAMTGLDPAWAPPLRPLDTSGARAAGAAARGRAGQGGPGTAPYPVTGAPLTFAWRALPLHRPSGALVAVRPDGRGFGADEAALLDMVAEHMAACTARLTRPGDRAPDTRPRMRPLERGAFTLDLRTHEVECDRVVARMHGLPPEPVVPLADFLAPVPGSDLPPLRRALEEVSARQGDYQLSYRVRAPGGGHRYLEARGRAAGGSDGAPSSLVGHITDVTAEREDRSSRERSAGRRLERSDRMLTLTGALAHTLTREQFAESARQAATAFGADAVTVAEGERGQLHVVTAHGQPPEYVAATEGLSMEARTPLSDAVRYQRPVFCPSPEALVAAYPHYAAVVERLESRAWAAVPLSVSGDPPAGCLLSFKSADAFGAEDQALFVAAGALLGRALERHRAFRTEQDRALELQHGLLPSRLPHPSGADLAAEYRPAAAGARAGGDWYDALDLPDGSFALAIGDVQGHSMRAAALMGRLRTMMRAYLSEGHPPDRVLGLANRLLASDNDADPDGALLATCCLMRVAPAERNVALAVAGHPLPLLHAPGHAPRVLGHPPGPPLGVDAGARYPCGRCPLPPGSELLLYTDGLVDLPGLDPDKAVAGLLKALADAPEGSAREALDQIFESVRPAVPGDDVAVLLARLDGDGHDGGAAGAGRRRGASGTAPPASGGPS
ncbi:SpoIIE family protein phosphatase [Streptomyces sp. HK10]|uniref:SpoIIE family protein phosphatase n=1 Tax=Streptomyces sp. HK10 TaxID=3373255 RepID=UPI00374A6108